MRTDRKLQACAAGPGLVLAVLAPKCPLCVAAWLAALGLGTTLAPWLKPLLLACALGLLAASLAVTRKRRRTGTCCDGAARPRDQRGTSSP
jgi:hypothetical protein